MTATEPSVLYLDCQAGIAGDMLVAALLDLGGASAERSMRDMLESLNVGGFEVEVSRRVLSGIDCCDFDVKLDAEHDGHDHDMAYLHGSGHHLHEHEHEHEHEHGAAAHAHHHGHRHAHRGLAEIDAIIDAARMTSAARTFAHKAFDIIAQAESKAHGVPVEEVHFHEVGAVDSIVDILSAAVLVDFLGIKRAVVPVLVDGHGTIRCQHGIIPVPVPATLNICIAHGLPLAPSDIEGELVTPTGAALVAALEPAFELPARYAVRAVGLGAGKRTYSRPSILRAMLIDELPAAGEPAPVAAAAAVPAAPSSPAPASFATAVPTPAATAPTPTSPADLSHELLAPKTTIKIECDIDDATPEALAFAAERLRDAGAREVHWLPIYAKKGRPAWQLQVICANEDVRRMQDLIFLHTTTIGMRMQQMERRCLERRFETVATPWGEVALKVVTLPDGSERATPEYEDCAAIARREDLSIECVMQAALTAHSR